jgi:TPR repeat protein
MRTTNEKALSDLLRRAEQGSASAQCNLGVMYANGMGVPQDFVEAASWFQLAAEQGNAPAQCNLGLMYRDGHGMSQDYTEATNWFRLAADQGVVPAQYSLGVMCRDGEGVPRDSVEACKWLTLAVARATAERQPRYTEVREKLAASMTEEQVAEAERLVLEWKPKNLVQRKPKHRAGVHVKA